MAGDDRIRPSARHVLWRYACGYMPDFLNKDAGAAGWVRWKHRGVQPLDKIEIPKAERRHVNSKKFEIRFDTVFEETLRACADPGRFGKTWITPNFIVALLDLHRMGYAHSWEAWQEGKLAGGGWGVQIGGYVNMSSIFHRVSHASKAAVGQALFYLRDRGFKWVDTGVVPGHSVQYGSEWWPRWKFEMALKGEIRREVSFVEGGKVARLPAGLDFGAKVVGVGRAVSRRVFGERFYDPVEVAPAKKEEEKGSGEEAA